MVEDDHICDGTDSDFYYMCINGIVYGPCDSNYCSGACQDEGDCYCDCHTEVTPTEDALH